MTIRLVSNNLPSNPLSIEAGVASLTLEPFTRELTDGEKTAIRSAKRVRIFIDNRVAAILSRPLKAPIQIEHYPPNTLRWCISIATSIMVGVFDCRKPTSEKDVEALLSKFDNQEAEEKFCVIRILTDGPFSWANYLGRHRPYVPFQIEAAPSVGLDEKGGAAA